jgi:hypothetical protein
MNDKEIQDKVIKGMYKIFDKLEQRIATLERVLQSHAKVIGEIRASEIELNPDLRKKIVKRLGEFHEQS